MWGGDGHMVARRNFCSGEGGKSKKGPPDREKSSRKPHVVKKVPNQEKNVAKKAPT